MKLNASSLNSGIYFARIEGLNGSKTVKLIKQ
ncbi:T9SS type A sorting domain-containing protein [Winogradskyella sp.]